MKQADPSTSCSIIENLKVVLFWFVLEGEGHHSKLWCATTN